MAQRSALITCPLGLRRPVNRSEVWPRRKLVLRWVNHCLFALLMKEVTNRISVRLALGFHAPSDEFHQLLKMLPKCAGDEVLAGFKRHREGFTGSVQIIV